MLARILPKMNTVCSLQFAVCSLTAISSILFAICYLLFAATPVAATAGINQIINFQGKVANSDGTNVSDGAYDFVFKIYNGASSGSTALFTETWSSAALFSSTMSSAPAAGGESLTYSSNTNEGTLAAGQILWNTTKKESVKVVAVNTSTNVITISPTRQAWSTSDTVTNRIYVKDGLFTASINSLNHDLSGVDFNSDSIYLGINFNSDGEMKPRIQFSSVPYAFNAQKVNGVTVTNTAGGTPATGTTIKIGDSKTIQFNNSLTFAGTDGKTLTVNNTITFGGTDGTSFTLPGSSDTLVGTAASQALTNKSINGLTITTATATTANYTKSGDGVGGLMYSGSADTWSYLARGNNGDCLKSTSSTIQWSSCGGAGGLFTQGSGFAYLTSTTDGVVLGGSTTSAGDFWFDTTNANLYLGVDTVKNGGLTFRSSGSSITDASITTNSTGDLILSAPSGSVSVGSGSGNIALSLTNAADLFQASKTLTLSGAYTSSDFTFNRNMTDGSNTEGGAVLAITDTSNGSSTINPDMLVIDAHPSSGTFTGNLLRLELGGSDKFVVNSAGNVTTGGTYNGLTISTTSGTLGIASGKTFTVNNTITLAATDGKTISFGANNITLTTSGATTLTLPTSGTVCVTSSGCNQSNTNTGSGTNGQLTFYTGTNTQSSDSNLLWDNTNKRLAVGAITATTALDVNGLIRVRNPQGETAAPTRANNGEFAFANVSAQYRLYFQSNGTAAYIANTSTGDYSEYFAKTYPGETLVPGMVIGTQSGKATRSARTSNALGIVSAYGTQSYNTTDGDRNLDPSYVNVGLLGQIPTIVSNAQGAISSGDPIGTDSPYPGTGAKASSNDKSTVGFAEQDFNPDPATCQAVDSLDQISWPKLADNQLPDNTQCFKLPYNIVVGKILLYVRPASAGISNSGNTLSDAGQLALQQLSAGANGLTTSSNLTVNGDLAVKGALSVGGPAQFQGSAVFKAIADFFDKVVFHKSVQFADHVEFNQDAGGTIKIAAGQTSVDTTFKAPYPETPIINVSRTLADFTDDLYASLQNTPLCQNMAKDACQNAWKQQQLTDNPTPVVTQKTANGFTISLSQPATQDLYYSWSALAINPGL